MTIKKKIISFIVFGFLLVSVIFTFNSISTLKNNQQTNLDLFKKEFLELSRELFEKNSSIFFNSLDLQNSNHSDSKTILDFIKKSYPQGGNITIVNIADRKFLEGYDNPNIIYYLKPALIDNYIKENILNQKSDFDLDNFDEFSLDKTNTIIPNKIHLRVYSEEGIIVFFGQNFLTGKVRIEFIERQNDLLFKAQIYSSILIFTIIFTLIIIFMVMVMEKIIIKPLKNIVLVVKSITGGDLNKRVDIKSKDEIGQLGLVFNEMTNKLRDSYNFLEDKIKERTKELDSKVQEITSNNIELENNKTVIINLLEDFENEKVNAENLVIVRTKELSDEKARLLASINSLEMGFAIVGIDGDIIINNPSILSILNMKENDSISLDDISIDLNIKEEGLFERLKKCTKQKCIVEINEIIFGTKYLRLFLTPVFSLENIPIGGVLLIENITESKILERSRDEFFAVASHELRTPLTAIRGNTEMILTDYKDKIKDKEIEEMLSDIDEASVRLIGIVNDFLEVSRLEQGNILINKTNFNLIEIAEKASKSLEVEAVKKNIKIEIIKPDIILPKAFADSGKVEQIFFNLIGNAIKFTEKGNISISFENIMGNSLKVRITDTGKGISINNESLLFRKFQPAGNDVLARDVTKSTGLGLYISKMIVEKMGGTIGLEKTEVGTGSTFFFTIPTSS